MFMIIHNKMVKECRILFDKFAKEYNRFKMKYLRFFHLFIFLFILFICNKFLTVWKSRILLLFFLFLSFLCRFYKSEFYS